MGITKTEKVHGIVHTAAASAAGVGAGLAQIPISDVALILPIQAGMICAISLVHGRQLKEASATAILGTFSAAMFGRAISQALIGWIPGAGNAINASTAAALTEAIGWSAHNFFQGLGSDHLTEAEVVARARANISMTEKDRAVHVGFLKKKSLLDSGEKLLAFYNTAVVSPIFDADHTNTCMFVTDKRVVQVRNSQQDQAVPLSAAKAVHVEHNINPLSDDYVIVLDRAGLAHRFAVRSREIAEGMKSLIEYLATA